MNYSEIRSEDSVKSELEPSTTPSNKRSLRMLAVLTALALLMSLFASCSSGSDEQAASTETAKETPTAVKEAPTKEVVEETPEAEETPAKSEAEAAEQEETVEVETITVEHAQGSTEVPVNPETLVVMDMGIFLTLNELGIDVDAIAPFDVPIPDEYVDVIAAPEHVGTAFEPDYEAINALEPDLIVVYGRSASAYEEMSKIAPTVDLSTESGVDYITGFMNTHHKIAEVFPAVSDDVDTAMASLQAEIDAISAEAGDAGGALTLLTTAGELAAFGAGQASRYGYIYDQYGFVPADESLVVEDRHGQTITFEYIADTAPETIFVVDRGAAIGEEGESAASLFDNDLVNSTPAAQNDRIIFVDAFFWYLANSSIPGLHAINADLAQGLKTPIDTRLSSGDCVEKTGEVLTVYSGRSENLVKPVLDAFTCDTGTEVKVRWGKSVELALLINEEGDKSPADVFLVRSPGSVGFLEGENLLKPLPQELLDLSPAQYRSANGYWVGLTGRQRVAVYNLDNVSEDELPASVFDLTDPAWKGRVAIPATNGSFVDWFTVFRDVHGDEVAAKWLADMKANDAKYYPNNRSVVEAAGRGEIDLGLVNHYYNYQEVIANGDAHRAQNHVFPNDDIGSLLIITAASQLASSDNDEAAQALIKFMLQAPAQTYYTQETFEYPLAAGVPENEILVPLASFDQGTVNFDALGGDFNATNELIEASGLATE